MSRDWREAGRTLLLGGKGWTLQWHFLDVAESWHGAIAQVRTVW